MHMNFSFVFIVILFERIHRIACIARVTREIIHCNPIVIVRISVLVLNLFFTLCGSIRSQIFYLWHAIFFCQITKTIQFRPSSKVRLKELQIHKMLFALSGLL